MIRDQINCLEGGQIDTSSGIIKNKPFGKRERASIMPQDFLEKEVVEVLHDIKIDLKIYLLYV